MNDMKERDKLVLEYKYLADQIACRRKRRIYFGVQLDDLKSAAYLGLIDAANRFDTKIGDTFRNYASIRINGEISDYLRKWNGGRSQKRLRFTSLDSYDISTRDDLISREKGDAEIDSNDAFFDLLKNLNPTQKKIIYMYYFCGINMKRISDELGYSLTRISQIASAARFYIKGKIERGRI